MKERIDAFIAHLQAERSHSPNTVSAYRNDLLQFSDYLEVQAARQGVSGFAIATIDRERLGGYFLHLRERGYSPASIARKMAALRALFQHLRRQGEVAGDPTAGIGSPEVKKPLPKTVDDDDVRTLLRYCQGRPTPEGQRDYAMLQLLNATGMRVGELVMVDLADVDFANRRVRAVGRGNRQRFLPLDDVTLAVVRSYVDAARPYLVRNSPDQTALIVNQRGQRLTRQGFWLIMKSLVKDAGLPPSITPHMLRHSFATHQIGEGLGLEELRQLLGHASIATTQVYRELAAQPATPTEPAAAEAAAPAAAPAESPVPSPV